MFTTTDAGQVTAGQVIGSPPGYYQNITNSSGGRSCIDFQNGNRYYYCKDKRVKSFVLDKKSTVHEHNY